MKKPISLDDLKPDPSNPRKISAEAMAGLGYSVEEFGDLSGITWNARTGELVCGHQRVTALREKGAALEGGAVVLGSERFAVRVVDWPRKKQRAANVVANNPHIGGDFDGLDLVLPEIRLDLGEDTFSGLRLNELELAPKTENPIEDWDVSHEQASAWFVIRCPLELTPDVKAKLDEMPEGAVVDGSV